MVSTLISYFATIYLMDKVYKSSAILTMDIYSISDDSLILRNVKTYSAVATSNQVMDEIINRLNLNYSSKDLHDRIEVTYDEHTGLIYIEVEDKDANTAFNIANTLIEVMMERINEIFGENYLKVLDNPYIPTSLSKPNLPLNIVIALLFSTFISALIIIWDERIR